MPDDGLESFCVRGDCRRIDHRHDDARICDLRRIASVAPDDASHLRANFLREFQRTHDFRTDVAFKVAAAD